MTGTRHTGFPQDGEAGVEAHLVDAETGDEPRPEPVEETETDRLQREARRAYQAAGGVTGGAAGVPPGALAGESPGPAQDPPPGTEGSVEAPSGEADGGVTAERGPLPEEWQVRLAEVERERDEYLDSLRRIQADFENYRKRIMKQETAAAERAREALVEKLLPVLDTVDLAERHRRGGQAVPDAVTMIAGSLAEVLAKEGLERIDPGGEPFDPAEHEAVAHEEAADGDGAGEPAVAEVMRAGYRWRGRVIRPAMVKVRG